MKVKPNRLLFYILSFTWGLLTTIVGAIVMLGCMIFTRKKPTRFLDCWYIKVGKIWGGFSLGPFIITDRIADLSTLKHEHGHSIQNCVFGPLWPFIIGIPSVVRYWYRKLRKKLGLRNKTKYYAIWFEKQATEWGCKLYNYRGSLKVRQLISCGYALEGIIDGMNNMNQSLKEAAAAFSWPEYDLSMARVKELIDGADEEEYWEDKKDDKAQS